MLQRGLVEEVRQSRAPLGAQASVLSGPLATGKIVAHFWKAL